MTVKSAWIPVGCVAAVAVAFCCWPSPSAPPSALEAVAPAAVDAAAPAPQQGGVTVPPPAKAPEPAVTDGFLVFPDGSRMPPLNGVKVAPKLVFHRMAPFAPVVGKETDAHGLEWYVHQNGLRTTTRLQADGKAVAEMTMPASVQPTLDR